MIEIASCYCDERTVTPGYREALHRVARSMKAAGITPLTLTDATCNRWLASLGQSPTTRSNYRRMAVTLWKHAADLGLTEHYPKRVVRVKPRVRPPVAWTMGEMSALIHATRTMRGKFKRSRCPMELFFRAWVRVGYETGLRFSDLLSLQCRQLQGDRLYITQNKTGVPVPKRMSAECVQDLNKLASIGDGKAFFAWAICKKQLREHFGVLCRNAGVEGTPKWLRRTGATHCEIQQPGSAGRFLGQLSPGLAYRFYVDRTQVAQEVVSPPAIPLSS